MKKNLILIFCSLIIAKAEINGLAFYDYEYNLSKEVFGAEKNSFSFKRVYFTYKSLISDDLSFTFQTDVGNIGDDPGLTSYLKKAQLNWNGPLNISLGMQGMNMFNVKENNWGFRFIEKSPMDKHKFSSSSDMGIGISGNKNNLSYNLLITNGSGYKKQETDAYKKTSIQFVYGDKKLNDKYGINLGTAFSHEPYSINDTRKVISFFNGFANNKLRVGSEYDLKIDTGLNNTEQIIAFYSSYQLNNNFEGLVFIDIYDPDIKLNQNLETYMIFGLNYNPTKGFILSPNIRMNFYENVNVNEKILKINFQFNF